MTLVFPDGRLPSPGWRWVLYAYLGLSLILPVSYVAATASALSGHHLVYLASGEVASQDAPPSWTELVFFGTVGLAWLGAVLPLSSPVAVAASTLVAAALFSPLRRKVQRVVDRRFNRARYDADAAVAAFAGRLQDAVTLDAVRADLLASVTTALEPEQVSIWLDRDRR